MTYGDANNLEEESKSIEAGSEYERERRSGYILEVKVV
jgi:hypothetical protein